LGRSSYGKAVHGRIAHDRSLAYTALRSNSWEDAMAAFNTVRFRVKPGRNQDFLEAHEKVDRDWPGLRHVNIVQTGDQTFCIIGEWDDMDALANARPRMLATLDTFREMLEEHEDGSVTDPVSGPVVLALK
jgi:quinol monooxygenase YgiN